MNVPINASKLLYGILACAAGAAVAAPSAEPAEPFGNEADVLVSEVVINYADLNLAVTPGAEALYRRIERASARVCGPRPSGREWGLRLRWQECRDTAISAAVEAVNSPLLTNAHRRGSPNAVATVKASRR